MEKTFCRVRGAGDSEKKRSAYRGRVGPFIRIVSRLIFRKAVLTRCFQLYEKHFGRVDFRIGR